MVARGTFALNRLARIAFCLLYHLLGFRDHGAGGNCLLLQLIQTVFLRPTLGCRGWRISPCRIAIPAPERTW